MTKISTVETVNHVIKVIQTSNSRSVVEGAIKRLASYGFSKEQIAQVLRTKTNRIVQA